MEKVSRNGAKAQVKSGKVTASKGFQKLVRIRQHQTYKLSEVILLYCLWSKALS